MRESVRRGWAGMLLAAVLSILVAGCASLPTTGPVVQGSALPEAPVVRPVARPPVAGMTPEDIVAGFLRACTGLPDDLVVAREYLTASAGENWDPAAATRVIADEPLDFAADARAPAQVNLMTTQKGVVDGSGHWSPRDVELTQTYALRNIDGEWRIDAVPPGITVRESAFRRVWSSRVLYFANPKLTHVVPDPVVSPATGSQLATALVLDLLAGPGDWIAPAVVTGIPQGTRLEIAAVPVADGVASIELSRSALEAGDQQRRAMSAQFAYTLAQVPGVAAFRILVDGQPLPVPGAEELQSVASWDGFSPTGLSPRASAYLVGSEGAVQRVADGQATAVAGSAGQPQTGFTSIVVPTDESAIIGRIKGGQLLRAPMAIEAPEIVDAPAGGPVAIARDGAIWVVADGKVSRVPKQGMGAAESVELAGIPGPVRLAVPSRDGARVALIVGPKMKQARLYVARADSVGGRTVLADAQPVPDVGEGVRDVAWPSGTTLAVVQAGTLAIVDLGRGSVTRPGGPPEMTAVAAADDLPTLVSAIDGQVFALRAGRWQSVASGSSPAYPG